jgi:putative glycerol-1-phosphate prenyltransferase
MLLQRIFNNQADKKKCLAVLLDPDKTDLSTLPAELKKFCSLGVDYFFVGGSLISGTQFHSLIDTLKLQSEIPVIVFPGSNLHIHPEADGIFLLSLISGRNPELLIGQHVIAAPILRNSGLEILPTGYMLVDSGRSTTVSYISNSQPIPADKEDIAVCTAMAGEMLGLKIIYLDGGSGAIQPVPAKMIAAVRRAVACPLVVGGGINSAAKAENAWEAGADIVVVGNGLEKDPGLIHEITDTRNRLNYAGMPIGTSGMAVEVKSKK